MVLQVFCTDEEIRAHKFSLFIWPYRYLHYLSVCLFVCLSLTVHCSCCKAVCCVVTNLCTTQSTNIRASKTQVKGFIRILWTWYAVAIFGQFLSHWTSEAAWSDVFQTTQEEAFFAISEVIWSAQALVWARVVGTNGSIGTVVSSQGAFINITT